MSTEVATSVITTEPPELVGGAAVLVGAGGGGGGEEAIDTIIGLLAERPIAPTREGERYWATDTEQEFIGQGAPLAWVEMPRGEGGGGFYELRTNRLLMTNFAIEYNENDDALDILYWPGIAETTPLEVGDIVTNKVIMGNYQLEYNAVDNTLDISYVP